MTGYWLCPELVTSLACLDRSILFRRNGSFHRDGEYVWILIVWAGALKTSFETCAFDSPDVAAIVLVLHSLVRHATIGVGKGKTYPCLQSPVSR